MWIETCKNTQCDKYIRKNIRDSFTLINVPASFILYYDQQMHSYILLLLLLLLLYNITTVSTANPTKTGLATIPGFCIKKSASEYWCVMALPLRGVCNMNLELCEKTRDKHLRLH